VFGPGDQVNQRLLTGLLVRHHRLRDCDADWDTGAAPLPPRQSDAT
jgi:hypothetical protein